MRKAAGEFRGDPGRAAFRAVRMNELDKLESDDESEEGLSSVPVSTRMVARSPPVA
jgi:hypothetical protein